MSKFSKMAEQMDELGRIMDRFYRHDPVETSNDAEGAVT